MNPLTWKTFCSTWWTPNYEDSAVDGFDDSAVEGLDDKAGGVDLAGIKSTITQE